ncbi:hypothetical protein EF847_02540 [Actinobacteria bacterium YIM 96077]|uniref:Uncharacterized protein n=1 Tax=Phytoactinopolyspora halophila TaxID=1981511 RepID=A0A329QZP6_9ACTN|nr:hypothetical protein [Phytoactinopolyspora halophila]AYY11770.1 hypothetical protein EF847_02540 [Actinobacteria bacterium YIM 96077]RAW17795.1 hypothetical protein DPM12_02735 [Phytoactinopolyspora halophila]
MNVDEIPTHEARSARHRILMIRPWDMSDGVGAGCCSGGSSKGLCVEPEHHPVRGGTRFDERAGWQPFARAYVALREALPDEADLEIVDPRNHWYLVPTLVRDARRRGAGWLAALRTALRAPAYAAIIVDGVTISSGELLEPDEAVRTVREALQHQRR